MTRDSSMQHAVFQIKHRSRGACEAGASAPAQPMLPEGIAVTFWGAADAEHDVHWGARRGGLDRPCSRQPGGCYGSRVFTLAPCWHPLSCHHAAPGQARACTSSTCEGRRSQLQADVFRGLRSTCKAVRAEQPGHRAVHNAAGPAASSGVGRGAFLPRGAAPATSPSDSRRMRAPASRHCLIRSAWRGRSRMHAVISLARAQCSRGSGLGHGEGLGHPRGRRAISPTVAMITRRAPN